MERLQELTGIIDKIDEEKSVVLKPLVIDVVFMEDKLRSLRALPHIRIHPKNPARQETTAAGKQYKETMQAYLNAVKVLLTSLYRAETGAADELLEKLKEFEL